MWCKFGVKLLWMCHPQTAILWAHNSRDYAWWGFHVCMPQACLSETLWSLPVFLHLSPVLFVFIILSILHPSVLHPSSKGGSKAYSTFANYNFAFRCRPNFLSNLFFRTAFSSIFLHPPLPVATFPTPSLNSFLAWSGTRLMAMIIPRQR